MHVDNSFFLGHVLKKTTLHRVLFFPQIQMLCRDSLHFVVRSSFRIVHKCHKTVHLNFWDCMVSKISLYIFLYALFFFELVFFFNSLFKDDMEL